MEKKLYMIYPNGFINERYFMMLTEEEFDSFGGYGFEDKEEADDEKLINLWKDYNRVLAIVSSQDYERGYAIFAEELKDVMNKLNNIFGKDFSKVSEEEFDIKVMEDKNGIIDYLISRKETLEEYLNNGICSDDEAKDWETWCFANGLPIFDVVKDFFEKFCNDYYECEDVYRFSEQTLEFLENGTTDFDCKDAMAYCGDKVYYADGVM